MLLSSSNEALHVFIIAVPRGWNVSDILLMNSYQLKEISFACNISTFIQLDIRDLILFLSFIEEWLFLQHQFHLTARPLLGWRRLKTTFRTLSSPPCIWIILAQWDSTFLSLGCYIRVLDHGELSLLPCPTLATNKASNVKQVDLMRCTGHWTKVLHQSDESHQSIEPPFELTLHMKPFR